MVFGTQNVVARSDFVAFRRRHGRQPPTGSGPALLFFVLINFASKGLVSSSATSLKETSFSNSRRQPLTRAEERERERAGEDVPIPAQEVAHGAGCRGQGTCSQKYALVTLR